LNIYEVLNEINWMKASWFKYKFPDLRYDQSKPLKTEEDFLRLVGRKSTNAFLNWEKTNEYKSLLMLYLETKVSDDYMEIYDIIVSKAKEGDEKSIRIFINLQKDIQQNAKVAAKTFVKMEEEESDSDLELD
jgi:hypothetical protein